jgi:large subunit ribosomal protein L5
MDKFLNALIEFVLPRPRDFNGIVLPPKCSSSTTPSTVPDVMSFGLPPEAMVFTYPFRDECEGEGAQGKARAFVSGFQVPFVRR